ncbi:gastrula zinc finger protein XlCGF26.1-like isoform X2 [Cydia pomonella]|uniref:gastrula zinc finger protein XlCGF26.1-like isoform X2 n=1 Tax=Cydia pomonella TaxID=82600 RepID=UPI002ADE329A|nr:gastrula zinc finger protein XlCGF26.1-like isoform X2 [Cydia pomonella]
MSETELKLCKICLNSKTQTGLFNNPPLNKFFSHVLGIHEHPIRTWLCAWCGSTLKKIMRLVQLAEESHAYLSQVKLNKEEHRISHFVLSFHHNEHTDIPPSPTKDTRKTKLKTKHKIKNKLKHLKETENVQVENNVNEYESEYKIEEIKLEAVDVDGADDDIENDEFNDFEKDTDETLDTDILDRPKRKVNPKLYAKCEQYNFTLKVLSIEEQRTELEEKKKSEKYLSRKYKCEFCGISFVTKDVFEEHNQRHQESHSPHECPLCRLRFSTALVLSQHVLAHARRFTCRLCGAVVTRYSDCESHRRKCGQASPGVCSLCGKIFTNQNSLDNHVRGVHYRKEKKFVCSYCNQKFQTKQRLAIHTRTHTGLKPYTCELCGRSFAANSNLRNHLAAHAQARPHYCVECDKSYKTRKGLRRHLLEGASHVGKKTHSCHHCLKSFTSEKLLASHISSVHTREPDSCTLCQMTFLTSASLKKHIRSVHEPAV